VEDAGDSTQCLVSGLGRSTAMEKDCFRGSPAQSWSSACSLVLWGGAADASMYRLEHVQYRWSL